MTMHYSDRTDFVSERLDNKSNGMTGATTFHENQCKQPSGSNGIATPGEPPTTTGNLAGKLVPGTPITCSLRKLARAYQFAVDCDRSRWDFAVEIADLNSLGVSHDELRWMIGKGLVEHAREVGDGQGIGRTFDSPGGFMFSSRSCFVVTSTGLQLANELTEEFGDDFLSLTLCEPPRVYTRPEPNWDDQRHELRLGSVLVKRFKWRAANQEAVLAAFQEDGWPARIDDPLPPVPETDPKRRLSDTIKCLNRKQQNSLIRFSGDGTGEGVLWDIVSNDE